MFKKRGFEIQFNWIFVLVAGAAILILFTAVIVKQKGLSETSAKATVLKSMESIIASASVSTDTIKKIDIPNSNIEVSCNRISIGGISKQYQNLILFAPNSVKGDKLITQTLAFSVPYRAVNLLYMTSSKVRYIIIANSDNNLALAKAINKSLPSDLKKEFYETIPTIRNENNYKVRFIVFGNINLPEINIPNSDVTALKVTGNDEKGTIEFWQKTERGWSSKGSSKYLGKSSLIGAVYSDTLELYKCNMENAFKRVNLVTSVYRNRLNNLLPSTTSSSSEQSRGCGGIYNSASTQFGTIITLTSNFANLDISAVIDGITQSSQSPQSPITSLITSNGQAKVNSCPLIY